MAIQIFTPEKTLLVNSVIFYLYTDPGLGKSTIAHTAKNPVIFDFDKGQHRVSAELRRGTIVRIDSWLDLEKLKDDFYQSYDTIVADTVGAMLDMIKDHLSKNQDNLQRDKTLTLKAQGLAGNSFMKMVRKWQSFGKDVVFIAHAVEEEVGKEKIKVFRPDLAGKNRNLLCRMADVMGCLQSATDENGYTIRTIYFNPSPNYHGKNSGRLGSISKDEHGNEVCSGQVHVPDLLHTPTFLADLLKQSKDYINTLTPAQAAEIKALADLQNFQQPCNEINHAGELNQLTESLEKDHIYYQSMRQTVIAYAEKLGFEFNYATKKWMNPRQFQGITDQQRDNLQDLLDQHGLDIVNFCTNMQIDSLMQIPRSDYAKIINDIANKVVIGVGK